MLFSSRLYSIAWCRLLFLLITYFLIVTLYHVLDCQSIILNLDLFISSSYTFSLSFFSTFYSSLFSFSVCFIALVVFAFSIFYISSSIKISYFLWLTFMFVASMLVLINFSDMFFVILGWDGLGVVSFFLILFYQNNISLFSAGLTLIINRLGDALLVLVIIILGFSSPFLGFFYSTPLTYILVLVIILGLSTKRALFPFSPWLPAAIAAPTPISSLVHSSTLVTAGLYLIIRNYSLLCVYSEILTLLFAVGLFTSFYAGLNSLFETDTKKVVALSTLSHLGFIALSLGIGWCSLAFLHLLSHAFFKSSLFIALGTYIATHYHYQDSRYFSSFSTLYPLYSSVILLSESNLLGFPFLRGFYSKDLVLESFGYSELGYFLVFIIYLNVIFTFSYSLRILRALVTAPRINSLVLVQNDVTIFSLLVFSLSTFSVLFSLNILTIPLFLSPLFIVSSFVKFIPFILLLLSYFFYLIALKNSYLLSRFTSYFLSTMIYLTPAWNWLYKRVTFLGFQYQRSVELGFLHWILVRNLVKVSLLGSSFLSYIFKFRIRLSMVYSVLFLFLLLFVFLIF